MTTFPESDKQMGVKDISQTSLYMCAIHDSDSNNKNNLTYFALDRLISNYSEPVVW